MKSKAKKGLILAIAALLVAGGIIGAVIVIRANQYVFKLALYEHYCEVGTTYPTYYFVLNKNNVLYCAVGDRRDDILDPIKYNKYLVSTERSGKKQLSNKEVKALLDLANYIDENGEKPKFRRTSYTEIDFIYKGNVYLNTYPNGKLSELVNELRESSTIAISFSW